MEIGRINNKSCVFVNSQDEVRKWVADHAKSETAKIPVPLATSENAYWITANQRIFFSKPYLGKIAITERKIEKRFKRPTIRLSIGCGIDKQYSLGKLMYDSFIRGSLSEKEPIYIDGNPYNCDLGNLIDYSTLDNPQHIQDNGLCYYKSRFNKLRDWLCFLYGIGKADAEDIAQNAYLETYINNEKEDLHAANYWFVTAKNRAKDFLERSKFVRYANFNECEWLHPRAKPEYGEKIDIVALVSGNRAKAAFVYYLQGYTPTEIAKLMGCSLGNVSCYITRQTQRIRSMLNPVAKAII